MTCQIYYIQHPNFYIRGGKAILPPNNMIPRKNTALQACVPPTVFDLWVHGGVHGLSICT